MRTQIDAISNRLGYSDKRILDVGCHTGIVTAFATHQRDIETFTLGVDRDLQALKVAKHNLQNVVLADASSLPIKPNTFDIAFCFETLEHLTRQKGIALINELKLTCGKIILTTPNGFTHQNPSLESNELMTHQAGWTSSELRKLGFDKIRGMGFRYAKNAVVKDMFSWTSYWLPFLGDNLAAYYYGNSANRES